MRRFALTVSAFSSMLGAAPVNAQNATPSDRMVRAFRDYCINSVADDSGARIGGHRQHGGVADVRGPPAPFQGSDDGLEGLDAHALHPPRRSPSLRRWMPAVIGHWSTAWPRDR